MSTPLVTGDVWQLKVYTYQGNQLGLNVLFYRLGISTGSPTAENQIQSIYTQIGAVLLPLLENTAIYYGLGLTRWMVRPTPSAIYYQNGGAAGAAGAGPLPGQTTGMITKLTGLGGRANRGRVYVPFPARASATGSPLIPTVGYVTALAAYAGVILTNLTTTDGGLNGQTWLPVLKHGNAFPPSVTLINGATPRQKWATQRRRGDYGRANQIPPF
jgi:hypothetical protein